MVPALLGIPAVVALIQRIVTAVMIYFATKRVLKIGFALTFIGLFSAGLTELYDKFEGWVGELLVSAPSELAAAGLFLPSNTGLCVSIILSAEAFCAIFTIGGYILEKQWEVVK
ncbi:DUF5455 family protein [Shewanella xiamenensis]|uniref:DUF5455 family protein n=1 Tax=Shewanella xiamenensis TaxID=332186 RepID=UPI001184F13B|nr:DUF5455 family protein [Shewanella xiamenensis]MDV5248563.1 DUF5455 family protein [Shewanella xiamenensis]MDV5248572.1 DUF5455 family protein [Shewanella xiamenensis]MDV5248581.1 DUF5455 family protein [Shewanella xiamenensis]MDV5248590.1 DUF5455 family protein [Shewanella xiamenensis]TVL11318.1 hypothetical protein AYI91_21130 [Shewanella xiamenensis]